MCVFNNGRHHAKMPNNTPVITQTFYEIKTHNKIYY